MRFVEANGIRTAYIEEGPKNGEPIIFLHGFSASKRDYKNIIQELSGEYRCIAYDIRGHGDTQVTENGYNPETMARDLEALMDALGIREAFLVGHSMGGIIIQEFAATRPERARGLAIIGSSTRLTQKHSLKIAGMLADRLIERAKKDLPEVYRKTHRIVNKILGKEKLEDLEKFMIQFLATPDITLKKSLDGLREYKPKIKRLEKYEKPVLVIIGEKDLLVSIQEAGDTATVFPNAWMKIIKGGKHNLLIPRGKEIASTIRDFYEWKIRERK